MTNKLTMYNTILRPFVTYAARVEIKNVIVTLKDDTASIVECKHILQNSTLTEQLNYINIHFKTLPDTIQFFENQNFPVVDSIS